jgi:serine/threonine protein kinase
LITLVPEVIRHERYDYAADVYSFGLLMWEIITREKPFDPQSPIEAAGAVALEGKRPPFPEGIPSNVRTLIEECWTEQPSERMKVEQIIESIGEISGDMTAESWLAAPTGHPVYKQAIAGEEPARTHMNAPPQQKKKSLMQGLFRKK